MARPLQQLGTLSALGKATLAAALFAATGLGAAAGVLTYAPEPAEAQPEVQAARARNDGYGRREGRRDKDTAQDTAGQYTATTTPAAPVAHVGAKKQPRPEPRDRQKAKERRGDAAQTEPRRRNAKPPGAAKPDSSTGEGAPPEAPPADATPTPATDEDATAETPTDDSAAEEPAGDDTTSSEEEPTQGEGDSGEADGDGTDEGSSYPDTPAAPAES